MTGWSENGQRAQYLYIIGSSRDGPLKIGIAESPTERKRQLQGGHPHRLKIFWIYPCPSSPLIEPLIHRALAKHRLAGEWFDVPIEVVMATLWIIIASEAAVEGYDDKCVKEWSHQVGLCLECGGVHEPPDTQGLKRWIEDQEVLPSQAISA